MSILFLDAAVHLERADGGDQHDAVRRNAGFAAFDVHEFLGAEIGTEARLGDDVVGKFQRGRRCQHRVAAVRDIGERPAVDERRRAFEGLHQVRRQSLLEQHGHGAVRFEIAGADWLAVAGIADHDTAEPLLEIVEIARQAEYRHHFRSDGNVETVLARKSVGNAAERIDDRAQRAVVHVEHPAPGHAARIDAERVAPINMIVEQCGEQVVCRRNGMEIAGEVQVDVLHRHDLRITAAGGAAFDAERRAERRLADAQHCFFADVIERIGQAHGRRGLAFARRSRVDGGDQDQLAVGLAL